MRDFFNSEQQKVIVNSEKQCLSLPAIITNGLFTENIIVYNHSIWCAASICRLWRGLSMRRTNRSGSFFACLLINMLLNPEGLIPAAVLLIAHFAADIPLWWVFAAAGLWLAYLVIWMAVIGWAGRCGSTPDAPKENKNPYSNKHI